MLYIVRHGQTVWNAQNKVCGIKDVDLTETGIEQAKALACVVKEKNISRIINTYFRDMTNEKYFYYTLENAKLQ